jgi:hypothetical protein
MKSNARSSPSYGGYDDGYRKRHTSTDWKGIGIGDSFKHNLDYFLRRLALGLFYGLLKKLVTRLARLTGASSEAERQPKVKPQLSACYSTYPAAPAAYAAIGHTLFLEYEARVKSQLLISHLADYLKAPMEFDGVAADPAIYQPVAQQVTRWVQTRLLLEDLARVNALQPVEMYRLFCAAQETLQFRSLDEIVRAVILYGDVLPRRSVRDLHPLTREILQTLTAVSAPFIASLKNLRAPADFLSLGAQWVQQACQALAPFLPPPAAEEEEWLAAPEDARHRQRFGRPQPSPVEDPERCRIAPLAGPQIPSLSEPQDVIQQIAVAMGQSLSSIPPGSDAKAGDGAMAASVKEKLSRFGKAIGAAGGQHSQYQDMRSDLVDRAARANPFQAGPIEGNPIDGHEVTVKLDGDQEARGEIHDRAVELCEDLLQCEQLRAESRPITEAVQRLLYPNLQEVPQTERFRTSGALDPTRLVLAAVSPAVYRRYRIHQQADRRGRPLLVIACDSSGSLNSQQMRMVKLLSSGWLCAVAGSTVQVLAALYHSGQIRPGVAGPLVQWIFHPLKTLAFSRGEALRAVAALPNSGTGAQSDALSLAYLLEEAQRLAKGSMIYLILITDTQWNRSFQTRRNGREEVIGFFENAATTLAGRLHTTLVGLGVTGETGLEHLVEAVITVSNEELQNAATVAEKIGVYVAGLMRQRHRLRLHR